MLFLGLRLAIIEMKALISMFLRKYRVTTTYKTVEEIRLYCDTVLIPVEGFKIGIELRE